MSRRRPVSLRPVLLLASVVPWLLASPAEGVAAPIARSVWVHGPDAAVAPTVQARLDEVLDAVAPENRLRMIDSDVQVHIIPHNQRLTDLPLWANLRGRPVPDGRFDPYAEARTFDQVRGLGPWDCHSGPLHIAIGEEQIMEFADSLFPMPRRTELAKNLVHEIGHAVQCGLADDQHAELTASYSAAAARYPADIVGSYPAYTVVDEREYFAEGVAAWFEAATTGNYQRAWLVQHDPSLYDLLKQVFAVPPPPAMCEGERATSVLAVRDVTFAGTAGRDIVVGSAAADVINGGSGDDLICGLGGNDQLYGGYGDDRIYGGPGNDLSTGGMGDDLVVDPSGSDRLVAAGGSDTLDARDGDPPGADLLDGSGSTPTCLHDPDDQLTECPVEAPAPG